VPFDILEVTPLLRIFVVRSRELCSLGQGCGPITSMHRGNKTRGKEVMPDTPSPAGMPSYKPSGFYFRRALRKSNDPTEIREIAMTLCLEMEFLRQWVREHGMIPPKRNVMTSEARAKGWKIEA
jgi:hypothetical protein